VSVSQDTSSIIESRPQDMMYQPISQDRIAYCLLVTNIHHVTLNKHRQHSCT